MNLTKNNKFILYSFILGFLGFLVATYLTILHYKHIIPSCSISGGCEQVLTSQFASIGPIPISLLGSLFYLTVIVLCILILTSYKKLFIDLFYAASAIGFLVSVVLILIQALILHAFCQYCLTSETVSTGILILAYLDYRERKTN
jgi:uncharacterized membrane protein